MTTQTAYILPGPASVANVFGYWKLDTLPAERWAIVRDGELSDGGHGPITVNGLFYKTREAAERALAALKE